MCENSIFIFKLRIDFKFTFKKPLVLFLEIFRQRMIQRLQFESIFLCLFRICCICINSFFILIFFLLPILNILLIILVFVLIVFVHFVSLLNSRRTCVHVYFSICFFWLDIYFNWYGLFFLVFGVWLFV